MTKIHVYATLRNAHDLRRELFNMTVDQLDAYRSDLLIDGDEILRWGPAIPFLHFTRRLGTHLEHLHPFNSEYWPPVDSTTNDELSSPFVRDAVVASRMTMISILADPKSEPFVDRILYWDGADFYNVTPDEAMTIAARWKARLDDLWSE